MREMIGLPGVWKACNKMDSHGGIQILMGGVAEAGEWVGGLGYLILLL